MPQPHAAKFDHALRQQNARGQAEPIPLHDDATQSTGLQQGLSRSPFRAVLKHVLSKQEAADAVRAVLKPLYAGKFVSKDQFKAAAQSATHALVGPQASAGKDVKQVVQDCLITMGLRQAASQVQT